MGIYIDSNGFKKLCERIVNKTVKKASLDEHVGNKSNPHGVTKSQVGLGNVPNVATNNQTPTYTTVETLAKLVTGEKLGVAFGKIAKAVDELIAHLSDTSGNKHIPAGGSSGQILRWSADGTAVWGADNNTTYSAMTGASASAAGKAGLVPAPAKGNQAKYLRGDGTWQTPPDTNTTYSEASQSAAGLMSADDKKKLDGVAEGANAYMHPTHAAKTGVPTANQTPAFGGTFSVTQPVSDASGHITAMNSRTVKIPNTAASDSTAGLMSAADKQKLNSLTELVTVSDYNNVTITEIIYNDSIIRLKIVVSKDITIKAAKVLSIGELTLLRKETLAQLFGYVGFPNAEVVYQKKDEGAICLISNAGTGDLTISPGTYFI